MELCYLYIFSQSMSAAAYRFDTTSHLITFEQNMFSLVVQCSIRSEGKAVNQ